jgi:hypothetical protein
MLSRIVADLLVVGHLTFVVFVIAGGFLTWRWPRVAWAHIPCAVWGAAVEFTGWICPLTPWEVTLRRQAGQAGYEGGFIEHYIIPLIYPAALTPRIQIALGVVVVAINLIAYSVYFRRRAKG